jgi:chemotaxis protein methyltransferase CheR
MAVQVSRSELAGIPALPDLETELLLEGLYQFYGDDLRGYARALLKTRLSVFIQQRGWPTISALQGEVLRNRAARDALLLALCAQDVELFDQPRQFAELREVAGPLLRSYAAPKVWIPECTSYAEVFSVAIMLAELDVHAKTQIFATASSEALLRAAKEGVFPLDALTQWEANYRDSGGANDFAAYWKKCEEDCGTEREGQGRFIDSLRENITWAHYSLASDNSFNEFQLIVCRKPMRDFGPVLKRRALSLFNDSLVHFGVLALDEDLDVEAMPQAILYKRISRQSGLYRRAR